MTLKRTIYPSLNAFKKRKKNSSHVKKKLYQMTRIRLTRDIGQTNVLSKFPNIMNRVLAALRLDISLPSEMLFSKTHRNFLQVYETKGGKSLCLTSD